MREQKERKKGKGKGKGVAVMHARWGWALDHMRRAEGNEDQESGCRRSLRGHVTGIAGVI